MADNNKLVRLAKQLRADDADIVEIVTQRVPDLTEQMNGLTESADKTEERVFGANNESMGQAAAAWETTLQAYLKQLEDPGLSEEERRDIRDRIDKGNQMLFEKESENKKFLFAMDGSKKKFVLDVAKGLGGAAVAVLAYANKDKLGLPKGK